MNTDNDFVKQLKSFDIQLAIDIAENSYKHGLGSHKTIEDMIDHVYEQSGSHPHSKHTSKSEMKQITLDHYRELTDGSDRKTRVKSDDT